MRKQQYEPKSTLSPGRLAYVQSLLEDVKKDLDAHEYEVFNKAEAVLPTEFSGTTHNYISMMAIPVVISTINGHLPDAMRGKYLGHVNKSLRAFRRMLETGAVTFRPGTHSSGKMGEPEYTRFVIDEVLEESIAIISTMISENDCWGVGHC